MKKRYFLILSLILIFFISGCTGYKPLFNSSSLMIEIKNYTIEGDKESGERIYLKLANLHHALFIESSPGPVKYAAELLNLCSAETRKPLVPIQENTKKIVKKCLIELGLI